MTRPSRMFHRLMALFSVLVTIPLAVSGALLGFSGRQTVLSLGDDLGDVASSSLTDASASIVQLATTTTQRTTEELTRIGREKIEALSERHAQFSEEAVQKTSRQIIEGGARTLDEAATQMVRASSGAIEDSSKALRSLHSNTIAEVSDALNGSFREVLGRSGTAILAENEDTVLRLIGELNHEQAVGIAERADSLLEEATNALYAISLSPELAERPQEEWSDVLAQQLDDYRQYLQTVQVALAMVTCWPKRQRAAPRGRLSSSRRPRRRPPAERSTWDRCCSAGAGPPQPSASRFRWLLRPAHRT